MELQKINDEQREVMMIAFESEKSTLQKRYDDTQTKAQEQKTQLQDQIEGLKQSVQSLILERENIANELNDNQDKMLKLTQQIKVLKEEAKERELMLDEIKHEHKQ